MGANCHTSEAQHLQSPQGAQAARRAMTSNGSTGGFNIAQRPPRKVVFSTVNEHGAGVPEDDEADASGSGAEVGGAVESKKVAVESHLARKSLQTPELTAGLIALSCTPGMSWGGRERE